MAPLAAPISPAGKRSNAFTLIELLIVIGIVAALLGLALPAILKSLKTAKATRMQADLALIGTALEAYKSDFGDYPRFDDGNAADATTADPTNNSADPINLQKDRGARLLCRALLGPAQEALGPGAKIGFVIGEQAPDGANGPGFRIRPGGAGKVYGPYIQNDKFKLGNPGAMSPPGWDSTNFVDATLLDPNGNPILYYPAAPGRVNISDPNFGAFVCTVAKGTPQGNANPPLKRPLYNSFDNAGYGEMGMPAFLGDTQLMYIMGDRPPTGPPNGYLAAGNTATTTQAYLLWTAGPDGKYGFGNDASGTPVVPAAGMKTDDVTNFDMPADLRK